MNAHPLATLKFRENTNKSAPMGASRNCSVCRQFKKQLGGRMLTALSARVKRWACGDCAP